MGRFGKVEQQGGGKTPDPAETSLTGPVVNHTGFMTSSSLHPELNLFLISALNRGADARVALRPCVMMSNKRLF